MIPTRIQEIRQRLEQATPGPWRTAHRYCNATGVEDEVAGLGWDWAEDSGPPEPMRGVFARCADASFISHAHEDIADLLKAWDTREAALRSLVQQLKEYRDNAANSNEPADHGAFLAYSFVVDQLDARLAEV